MNHLDNRFSRTHLAATAAGLVLMLGGQALAQSAGSLTTRANVPGSISQVSTASEVAPTAVQTARVGAAEQTAASTGTLASAVRLSAEGTLTGSLNQTRSGVRGEGLGAQETNVGVLLGNLAQNRNAAATGLVAVTIDQLAAGVISGQAKQRVDVGMIRLDGGNPGNLVAVGTVSSGGISQTNFRRGDQLVQVGSIEGSQGGNVQAEGSLTATVTQTAAGGNLDQSEQRVAIGSVQVSNVGRVAVRGQVSAALSQTAVGNVQQSIAVAVLDGARGNSVDLRASLLAPVSQSSTDGTSPQVVALARVQQAVVNQVLSQVTVSGAGITQTTGGGTARIGQVVDLGGVTGGGSQSNATITVDVSGAISQNLGIGRDADEQRISVGSVAASTGTVTTVASVTGNLAQNAAGSGSASAGRIQVMEIATVSNTSGTVTAKAVVGGNITQDLAAGAARPQRIALGAVRDTGSANVSTNASVGGNLTQSASAGAGSAQNIQIGSVLR